MHSRAGATRDKDLVKHEKIEPAASRDPRASVSLLAEVRQGSQPWRKARLEDLSQTGFRISWLPNCRSDRPLRIRIRGLQLLSADVKWQDMNAVGCAFEQPLHVSVFEHIVREAAADS